MPIISFKKLSKEGNAEVVVKTSMKNCCVDSQGVHRAGTRILDPQTCSSRECMAGGLAGHVGHKAAYWMRSQDFETCGCCMLDGIMAGNGGWIISPTTGQNLTCCEGKLLAEPILTF